MRIKLIDVIGYADQEKNTYGLGVTLALKRNNKNDPIISDNANAVSKIDMKVID